MKRARIGVVASMFACVCGAACVTSPAAVTDRTDTPARRPAMPAFCRVARLALDAAIRPFDEQPLGLDSRCVGRVATLEGRVQVDARFSRDGGEPEPAPDCSDDRYVIRFDPSSFRPSSAGNVVLLALWSAGALEAWQFNAIIEAPDWPHRRPGTLSLSECGSAFGTVAATRGEWKAVVTAPPQSPDAL